MSAKPIPYQEGFASDLERLRLEPVSGLTADASAEWPKTPFSNPSNVAKYSA